MTETAAAHIAVTRERSHSLGPSSGRFSSHHPPPPPPRYPLTAIYRAILLTLDRLIEDVENQISGFVMVVDFSQFSLMQSKSVSPKMLRLMVNGLQVSLGGVCFQRKEKMVLQTLHCRSYLGLVHIR